MFDFGNKNRLESRVRDSTDKYKQVDTVSPVARYLVLSDLLYDNKFLLKGFINWEHLFDNCRFCGLMSEFHILTLFLY